MIDTYTEYDHIEAWQLEVGDPVVLDGEHLEILQLSDSADDTLVHVVGLSQETGDVDEEPRVIAWDTMVPLWKVDDEDVD